MDGLFEKVDCLRIPVPDLDTGLAFYRDGLGHQLIWRTDIAAGLALPGGESELVIYTNAPHMLEPNLSVASVEAAVAAFCAAGGQVAIPPFDIQIGRCAVVRDPWGNHLTILDASKGLLKTDADGNVIGNE